MKKLCIYTIKEEKKKLVWILVWIFPDVQYILQLEVFWAGVDSHDCRIAITIDNLIMRGFLSQQTCHLMMSSTLHPQKVTSASC